MTGKIDNPNKDELVREFIDLLAKSIILGSEVKKSEIKKNLKREPSKKELNDFVEKNGNAKQWLRARCLESVVTSVGLNEYLETLLAFRGSFPSRTAPLNLMFAVNQIVRALDPVAIRLLEELREKKRLNISNHHVDELIASLTPTSDFRVTKIESYFDASEVERLRNLLLEVALDKINIGSIQKFEKGPKILKWKALGKIPRISLRKLVNASNRYSNLDISIDKGILRWKYGSEPTIFVKNGTCYYDKLEIDSRRISYDSVRKQFYLMKKALEGKEKIKHKKTT